ncbi:YeeE/YedE family protein [Vibrio cholerae]|uniref:YeeE/YedE family protein n=2 Tax=Vibrio metoecus TaxID=1481663 RepID=UPI0006D7BC35|nr:YeeE/YedE family protein [Vibrio metoecus]EGQ9630819.1 YeeE/YedE family protein [Vibrio cholerae]QXC55875.1 YeeE/YedE family protein [Vibrio mimicus]EGQ9638184.1 YeeE/YedE family protein [Vibrio cholerae]EGR4260854.1 YeeE/YedE family protein [Vibrio cholerae]EGZ6882241.1 YeeE/YedE family protein [Vibrio cholerae]
MTFSIPWDSLIGGMLLGISATLMLLMNGKIAGISGILTGLLTPKSRDFAWRLLFVVGMVCGGVIGARLLGHHVPTDFGVSGVVLAAAGLLVGVGTRLANGCTSGHGICGIGRLSKRSIVATCVFMVVAAVTVFVRLHLM